MKKNISILSVLILSSAQAFAAAAPGTPEYEKMKEYKAAQRKAREDRKAGVAAGTEKKEPGFWDREAERSGFAQTGQGMGSVFKNLNPVPFFKEQRERYEERKAAHAK
jgi:ABC-type tungstate transport system permease subunit